MQSASVATIATPTPLAVFRERAEARATLVAGDLMDLQSAVDRMQEVAAAQGLVAQYGQDAVQKILGDAFREAR